MNRSRYLPTIVLAAALMLPYGAASLCAIFNPMTILVAVVEDSNGAAVQGDASVHQCDFAECSTAVVAPVPSLAALAGHLPPVELGTARLSSPLRREAIPPLTPPPIA